MQPSTDSAREAFPDCKGYFGTLYGPPKISFCPNGPHHHCWHRKVLYWVNLAHSEDLGTAFLRFGPKIAILAGFMATLWVRMAKKPKNGPHHHVQREKLLYWSNLTHSRYLGSSKCVFKSPPPFGVQWTTPRKSLI